MRDKVPSTKEGSVGSIPKSEDASVRVQSLVGKGTEP
jgi:hypothetical protein